MIESSKYKRENYPRKCFWTQERETQVKFNPSLSANRPLKNWAQGSYIQWSYNQGVLQESYIQRSYIQGSYSRGLTSTT